MTIGASLGEIDPHVPGAAHAGVELVETEFVDAGVIAELLEHLLAVEDADDLARDRLEVVQQREDVVGPVRGEIQHGNDHAPGDGCIRRH